MDKCLQKIFLLLIISFLSFKTIAQRDLITTNAGEEIRCKILDETPTRFIYAYLGPKNKVLRNEIFKNLVESFKYSHYSEDILKNDKLNNNKKSFGGPRIDTRKSSSSKTSRKSRKSKNKEVSIKKEPEKPLVIASPKIENKPVVETKKDIPSPTVVKSNKAAESQNASIDTSKNQVEKTTNEQKKSEIVDQKGLTDKPIVSTTVPNVDAKLNTDPAKKEVLKTPEIKKEDIKGDVVAKTNTEVIKKEVLKTPEIIKEEVKVENKAKINTEDIKKEPQKAPELKKEEVKAEVVAIVPSVDAKPKSEEVKTDLPKAPDLKIVGEVKGENAKKIDAKNETAKKEQEAKEKEEAKKLEELLAKAKAKEAAKSPFAEPEPISEFKNYLKFRVGVKGGLGNIIQKNSDTSPYGLYKEKLLRGWMFGADAAYFLNDKIGLGLMYNNYQASNSSKSLDYPDFISGETVKAGALSNKVSHKFIGPTLLYRKAIDFKTFAVLSISPGMHLYTDKGEANLSGYKHTGKAYGASATLGLDFLLGNDIYGRDIILSLEGGYNYGQITSLNYGGSLGTKTLANPINLNRLDFSIGLRFTRFPVYLR